ncbi:MAG: hypothetical protein CMP95_10750 [Gammaproteobacteria bacterium]|nr:hypothetical protein [Gammaproteobacteria bacterium]OUV66954.1 MAG: hypothetical protein CBC93_06525 [Gammaproteobacteria bacterium TMED133]
MNKFIAKSFGAVLASWHVLVISILGVVLYHWYVGENLKLLDDYVNQADYPFFVVGVFILHILFSGVLSIMVVLQEQVILIKQEIAGLASNAEVAVNKKTQETGE